MTATPVITPPAAAPTAAPAKRKPRQRRWIRLALPLGLVLLFWAVTYTLHALDDPDLSDAGTFSPVGTGDHGSSKLAALLGQQGVTVLGCAMMPAGRDVVAHHSAYRLRPFPVDIALMSTGLQSEPLSAGLAANPAPHA